MFPSTLYWYVQFNCIFWNRIRLLFFLVLNDGKCNTSSVYPTTKWLFGEHRSIDMFNNNIIFSHCEYTFKIFCHSVSGSSTFYILQSTTLTIICKWSNRWKNLLNWKLHNMQKTFYDSNYSPSNHQTCAGRHFNDTLSWKVIHVYL